MLFVTATRTVGAPAPTDPDPISTSSSGAPSIVMLLSETSCPSTATPCIRLAFGTVMRSPLMLIRAGTGARMVEWVM